MHKYSQGVKLLWKTSIGKRLAKKSDYTANVNKTLFFVNRGFNSQPKLFHQIDVFFDLGSILLFRLAVFNTVMRGALFSLNAFMEAVLCMWYRMRIDITMWTHTHVSSHFEINARFVMRQANDSSCRLLTRSRQTGHVGLWGTLISKGLTYSYT